MVLMSENTKIRVRGKCGHEWEKDPDQIISKCPECDEETAFWRPSDVKPIRLPPGASM